ncbi:hypothetical protein HOU02_gp296 [Caulobacter phage CcrBL9]|uniref:Lipoprotein n=1 Tax=Caulobacter phage CcrBL9 TaxID=2283270 RepID=A0A385EFI4_9CAUD|nr:hypothetical protein HOU02_gp296 [Caulobacter phage CcrBL9]AXQ69429.1 hypothetical protein CcrBL9_gp405 [Caulobacter phage CcrBL9]
MRRNILFAGAGLALAALTLAACDTPQQQAINQAAYNASQRAAYVAKNALDFDNYNKRQRLSDNPSTIIWCTAVFPQAGMPPITVPIVGKLTSGGKRPFDTAMGPDGMYGSSGEYRYGFTPGGNMVEFDGIPTFCSNEPTVWQREKTTIVVETAADLSAATKTAQTHVAGGQGARADAILSAAVKGTPNQ